MKLFIRFILIFFCCPLFAQEVFVITENISKPESAYFYMDSIYISNIDAQSQGGSSSAKDHVGWITKTDKKGKGARKIVEGLSAPKGLRAYNDLLYVADIDEVFEIDLKKETISRVIPVPGAFFLNDLTVDSEGNVFVSDTRCSQIFKIENLNSKTPVVTKFMEHMKEAPNGLLWNNGSLYVASWGQDFDGKSSVKQLGQVIAIDINTKEIRYITKGPLGHLDGIELFAPEKLIVTAKTEDSIYLIDIKTGKVDIVAKTDRKTSTDKTAVDPADIGFIPSENIILVPNMMLNRVTGLVVKND